MSTPPPPRLTPWPVRPVTDEDWEEFAALDSHAFGTTMPEEALSADRALLHGARSIGAYDGTTLAGIAAAYSYDISVPGGGSLPAAAVSWVGVLPTHRRRGVLRALMTSQLHSIHEEGREPLAVLWASEPQIYGRFGYGLATRGLSLTVKRDPLALLPTVVSDPALRLRLVDAADWKTTAGVYAAVASVRPGMPARDEVWWQQAVQDLPSMRDGRSELRCVVAEDDGGVRAYARYRTKQRFDDGFGAGVVSVREVMGVDPAALASLYRYLFDLDLMGSTELWNRPVDDPLLSWLQDPRRAKPVLGDALYVRLVDLQGALRGRTFTTSIDVVLEVSDETCPWNAGRWRLAGGPDGSSCERTDGPADIALAVVDLGAAFLGGTTLGELLLAGRLVERRPGAVAAAALAFTHSPAPWCPAVF